jgi:hypothetical protein
MNNTAKTFATGTAGVIYTGGKFFTGVNDTGGKLPLVSMTPAVNLPPVSTTHSNPPPEKIEIQIA